MRKRNRRYDFFVNSSAPKFEFGLERASIDDFSGDRFPIFDRRVETYRERIKNHTCLLYRSAGGDVAAYYWVSEDKAPLSPWLTLSVPKGYRYIWDCKTDEAARGRGYYTNGLREIAYGSPCLIAVNDNPVARRAIENAGFQWFQTISTLNLGINLVNGRPVFGPLTLSAAQFGKSA